MLYIQPSCCCPHESIVSKVFKWTVGWNEHLNEQLRYWYHWQKTLVEVLILLIEVDVTNLLESTEDH